MIAPNAEQWSHSNPTPNSSLPTPPKDLLKGATHTKRSHVSNSRIKAAARKCAAKIKALVEAHDADIEAAYQEYRETVAQIEQREVHAR